MTEDILRKVRGLLDTAESLAEGGNEEAAAAYNDKAHALLSKYALDAALLETRQSTHDEVIVKKVYCGSRFWLRETSLLHGVAVTNGCRTVRHRLRQRRDENDNYVGRYYGRDVAAYMDIVGFERDIAAVEMLWTSLLVQSASALEIAIRSLPPGSNRWSFSINFLDAFNETVRVRLMKLRHEAVRAREAEAQDANESLLPVLQDRDKRVSAAVNERYGRLRANRLRGGSTYAGTDEGGAAGHAAHLGTGTSLPNARKAIGRG